MTAPLPPHQQLAAQGKWPVLGEVRPRRGDDPWRVSVCGLVVRARTWSLDELRSLPRVERVIDIHCVTRWSKLGVRFGGVVLRDMLESCEPLAEARFVSFVARSERAHSTSLPLADALALDTLIVLTCDGQPLTEAHGGPVRTVVPERYFYKSLKWLERIELLAEDRLGYWEAQAGYHNVADPWREQRYIATRLEGWQVRQLLARRDFSGHDLLGMEAQGLDLTGLNARAALLRNTHFERTVLQRACFEGANLTNAHFEGADLRGSSFRDADIEGANFRGADLRGCDFTGASLTATTFCPEPGDVESWTAAQLDAATRFDAAAFDGLTPLQQDFLRRATI